MTDFREMMPDFEEMLRTAIGGENSQQWTIMPAVVAADTKDGHSLSAQPTIKARIMQSDGTIAFEDYPQHDDVPIHHKQGGLNVHTFPTAKGDEIALIYTARPLDSWRANGATKDGLGQPPVDARQHSMADALALGGYRSDPRKLRNVSNEAEHRRSVDGSVTSEVHPLNGHNVKVADKNDASVLDTKNGNPFASALKFFQSLVHPADGHLKQAVDGLKVHAHKVTHDGLVSSILSGLHLHTLDVNGIVSAVQSGLHSHSLNAGGIISSVQNGLHSFNLSGAAGLIASANNGAHTTSWLNGITHTSLTSIVHNAPLTDITAAMKVSGASQILGGLSTGALEVAPDVGGVPGAMIVNGPLTVNGATTFAGPLQLTSPVFTGLVAAADDAAAATAGVLVGGIYQASGVLRVRLS